MRLQDDIDFTTLTWVKAELDETLKQARHALEAYVEDPTDSSQMRFCATYLHQVQGTLRMVELYGAAMVTEEMEHLASALLENDVKERDEAYAVLMRGIVQLPDYLERLQTGHKDIPIVLLPLLNDLRSARGEKSLSEIVLFTPDLTRPLPLSAKGPLASLPELELRQIAEQLRGQFQLALLNWFRNVDADGNVARIAQVCDKLVAIVSQEEARRLFWVAAGVMEALRAKAFEPSPQLKQTIGKVEREIKRLADAGEASFRVEPPRELTRNLLYFVAHAPTEHGRIGELRQIFRLEALLPTDAEIAHARGSMSGHNRALLDTVSVAIKEDLMRVKDALDLHLRTQSASPSGLGSQVEVLDRVADTLGMLGLGVARRVVQEQRTAVHQVATGARASDEATLLDIAGALLYVEASLDDQVQHLGGGAAEVESGGRALPQAEGRKVLEALVKEAQANFAQAKQCFVAFVESSWDHDQLQDVPRLLEEVSGAMRILELTEPPQYLHAIRRFTESELLARRRVPNGQQMDTLADALASLEYYLEAVREHRAGRDKILAVTRNSLETLGYWPVPEETSDPVAEAATPGATVEAPVSRQEPAMAPEATAAAPATSKEPVATSPSTLAPQVAAATPAPASVGTAGSAATALLGFEGASDEIDEEIREVFVEEVQEEIANLADLLPRWRADAQNFELLKPIRRVFHTLKGSGRLVGALSLGEFSWKIENMLNRVLDKSIQPTAAVQTIIEHALNTLPQLLSALRGEGGVHADIEGIKAVADRLTAGEQAWYEPAIFAAPEPEAAVEAVADVEVELAAATIVEVEPATEVESEPLAEVAATPDDEREDIGTMPSLVSLDPVLFDILKAEVAGHLETMHEYLDAAYAAPKPATDSLLRAVHTMNGAFAMTDVPVITDVIGPLEGYIKRMLAQGAIPSTTGLATIADAAEAVRLLMLELEATRPRLPDLADLAARIVAERDALPEPTGPSMPLHLEIEQEEVALTEAVSIAPPHTRLDVPTSPEFAVAVEAPEEAESFPSFASELSEFDSEQAATTIDFGTTETAVVSAATPSLPAEIEPELASTEFEFESMELPPPPLPEVTAAVSADALVDEFMAAGAAREEPAFDAADLRSIEASADEQKDAFDLPQDMAAALDEVPERAPEIASPLFSLEDFAFEEPAITVPELAEPPVEALASFDATQPLPLLDEFDEINAAFGVPGSMEREVGPDATQPALATDAGFDETHIDSVRAAEATVAAPELAMEAEEELSFEAELLGLGDLGIEADAPVEFEILEADELSDEMAVGVAPAEEDLAAEADAPALVFDEAAPTAVEPTPLDDVEIAGAALAASDLTPALAGADEASTLEAMIAAYEADPLVPAPAPAESVADFAEAATDDEIFEDEFASFAAEPPTPIAIEDDSAIAAEDLTAAFDVTPQEFENEQAIEAGDAAREGSSAADVAASRAAAELAELEAELAALDAAEADAAAAAAKEAAEFAELEAEIAALDAAEADAARSAAEALRPATEPEFEAEAEAEAEAELASAASAAEEAPVLDAEPLLPIEPLADFAAEDRAERDDAAAVPTPTAIDLAPAAEAYEASLADTDADPDGPLDVSDMDEDLLDIFLEEGVDLLDHSDGLMARLRETPGDRELVEGLQRDLHTLKGGARMAGIAPIGDLGHAMESLLEAVAEGKRQLTGIGVETLERSFDRLHGMVTRVGQRRALAMPVTLIERVEALSRGETLRPLGAPQPASIAVEASIQAPVAARETREPAPSVATPTPAAHSAPLSEPMADEDDISVRAPQEQIRIRADLLDRLVNYAGEVAIYRARLEQQLGLFRGNLGELDQTTTRLREQLRKLEIETEAQIVARYQREAEVGDSAFDPLELDRFSTLQQLSRALSESAADIVNLQTTLEDHTRQYETLLLQQSRVSSELQEGLMRTRMVPFDSLVPRLRRIIRQTAGELGKKAQLKVEGAQGEMDRNVLDRMTAPLEHMLRNALAHGLETPADRVAAGKPEEGTVKIAVQREGSEVVITVSDDGRGLDRDAIRRKAMERGLMKADAQLSDRDLYGFILETGFSTAETVSKIAGRGVGMDVVHSEIRQLGGSLYIESTRGKGSEFVVRLPFTLAVTQAVFVKHGDTLFSVPISSVQGVARIDRASLEEQLASDAPTFRYAGEDYSIYDLGLLLGQSHVRAEDSLQVPLLLARSGDQRAAICVDQVIGSREIVVKPVGPQVSSIPGIFGATIMGDGRVIVILDFAPLVRRSAAMRKSGDAPVIPVPVEQRRIPLVMVVDDSITMRKVTGRVLERHNYEVITAKDGVDAIEKLQERIPDVMLLDIEMPRMDGYELATHMRNDGRLRGIPIIMITSRTGEKHRQRAFEIGVDRYLGKPYQENELMRNVHEILKVGRGGAG